MLIFCENRIFFRLQTKKLFMFFVNTCQIPVKTLKYLSKTLAVRFGIPAYAGITMPPTLVRVYSRVITVDSFLFSKSNTREIKLK